jgi:4-alpha-glucanotransferase
MFTSRAPKKLSAILSCIYFLTNCALANVAEGNFWTERRRHAQKVNKKDSSEPLRLAGLPAVAASDPRQILRQLSSPDHRLLGPTLSRQLTKNLPRGFTEQNAALLNSLPYRYGSVRRITVPAAPSSGKTIIHIQDVHLNSEAQKNIGKTVQSLVDSGLAGLVALEGAFEPIDLSRFRAFPDQDAVRKVADYLLREHKISGPVHAAFTSAADIPPFIGVDDRAHYEANISAYRQSASRLKAYKDQRAAREKDLSRRKAAVFNAALSAFDSQVEAYRRNNSSLGDHVQFLTQSGGDGNESVRAFLKALRMESALDFKQVEEERALLIEQLVGKLTQEQISALLHRSVAYRTGQTRYADFYRYLRDLCRNHGIAMERFKAMDSYIQYVLLSDGIDPEKLFFGIGRLEKSGYDRLAGSPEEKRLVAESKRLHLIGKLMDFALTPEEWKEYAATKESGARNQGSAERQNVPSSPAISPFPLREEGMDGGEKWDLSSFESFYNEAHARDIALTKNLLSAMELHKTKAAVLVTGGFHSPGITDRLRRAGATVISFTPKIEKIDTAQGSAYLSVFTQEKTPLEKLFQGEKLFVSPEVWTDPTHAQAAVATAGVSAWNAEDLDVRQINESFDRIAPWFGNISEVKKAAAAGDSLGLTISREGRDDVTLTIQQDRGKNILRMDESIATVQLSRLLPWLMNRKTVRWALSNGWAARNVAPIVQWFWLRKLHRMDDAGALFWMAWFINLHENLSPSHIVYRFLGLEAIRQAAARAYGYKQTSGFLFVPFRSLKAAWADIKTHRDFNTAVPWAPLSQGGSSFRPRVVPVYQPTPAETLEGLEKRLKAPIGRGTGWMRISATPQEALAFNARWSSSETGHFEAEIARTVYRIPIAAWDKMAAWLAASPNLERAGYFLARREEDSLVVVEDYIPLGSLAMEPLDSSPDQEASQMNETAFGLYGIKGEVADRLGIDVELQNQLSLQSVSKDDASLTDIPVHSRITSSRYPHGPSRTDQSIAQNINLVYGLLHKRGYLYDKDAVVEVQQAASVRHASRSEQDESAPENLEGLEYFASPATAGLRNVKGTFLPPFQARSETNWGIGDFKDMRTAVDMFHSLGQNIMQVPPLNMSSAGNSGYSVASSKSLDPIYINIDDLLAETPGLARETFMEKLWELYNADPWVDRLPSVAALEETIAALRDAPKVDYDAVRGLKTKALRVIWEAGAAPLAADFQKFRSDNNNWLDSHMLYIFLKNKHLEEEKQRPGSDWGNLREWDWRLWPEGERDKDPRVLRKLKRENREELDFLCFQQFAADRQFQRFRDYARENGVELMIDIPFPLDGADIWLNPGVFGLKKENGYRRAASQGVPPEPAYPGGQYWQVYPYDWSNPATMPFILDIFRFNQKRASYIRLDHVLGYYRAYLFTEDVDAETTLENLRLPPGPGAQEGPTLFAELRRLQRNARTQDEKMAAAQEAERLVKETLLRCRDSVPDDLAGSLPPDAVRLTLNADGSLIENSMLLMARPSTGERPEGSTWQQQYVVEKAVATGTSMWDFIRLTAFSPMDNGFMHDYLFGAESGDVRPDDSLRLGYFKLASGEAMMSEFLRAAQERGTSLIWETLGTVPPEIQTSAERLGATNYIPYIWGEVPAWGTFPNPYHPDNHKENAYVTYGLHDSSTMKYRWEVELKDASDFKKELLAKYFGSWTENDLRRLTQRAQYALLAEVYKSRSRMAVLTWIDLLGLPENFRLNVPGEQTGQWSARMPLGLEELREAAADLPAAPLDRLKERLDRGEPLTPRERDEYLESALSAERFGKIQRKLDPLRLEEYTALAERQRSPAVFLTKLAEGPLSDRDFQEYRKLGFSPERLAAIRAKLKTSPLSLEDRRHLAGYAVSLIGLLTLEGARKEPEPDASRGPVLNVVPEVGTGVEQVRETGAEPFLVDAYVRGDPAKVRLIVNREDGSLVKRISMRRGKIRAAAREHGFPEGIGKWTARWRPKEAGRYKFHIEAGDQRSREGVLWAVEPATDLNPMSSGYGKSSGVEPSPEEGRGGALAAPANEAFFLMHLPRWKWLGLNHEKVRLALARSGAGVYEFFSFIKIWRLDEFLASHQPSAGAVSSQGPPSKLKSAVALAMALAPFAITIPFAFHIGILPFLKTTFIAAVFLRSLRGALSSVPVKTQLTVGLVVIYLTMAFSVLGAMDATGWGVLPDMAWRLSAAIIAGHAHLWNHFIAPLLGWAPLSTSGREGRFEASAGNYFELHRAAFESIPNFTELNRTMAWLRQQRAAGRFRSTVDGTPLSHAYLVNVLQAAGKLPAGVYQAWQREASALDYIENSPAMRGVPHFANAADALEWLKTRRRAGGLLARRGSEPLSYSYLVLVLDVAGKLPAGVRQSWQFEAGALDYAEGAPAIQNAPIFEDPGDLFAWLTDIRRGGALPPRADGEPLSYAYLTKVLDMAGKLSEKVRQVLFFRAGAMDYAEGSPVIQGAPRFESVTDALLWVKERRQAGDLSSRSGAGPLSYSYLVLVLEAAGKLPAGVHQAWQREAGALEYVEGSSVIQEAPQFFNVADALEWLRARRQAGALPPQRGSEPLSYGYMIHVLDVAGKLPPGARQNWQREVIALDFVENSAVIRNAPVFHSSTETLEWLKAKIQAGDLPRRIGSEPLSYSYLIQILDMAGKLPAGVRQSWQFEAGALEYAEMSPVIQEAPRFDNALDTLKWLKAQSQAGTLPSRIGPDPLSYGYLVLALDVAGKLPPGIRKKWQFEAGAFERAESDQDVIKAEIEQIWRDKTAPASGRAAELHLKRRFSPDALRSRRGGEPLSRSYRNQILEYALALYGMDYIASISGREGGGTLVAPDTEAFFLTHLPRWKWLGLNREKVRLGLARSGAGVYEWLSFIKIWRLDEFITGHLPGAGAASPQGPPSRLKSAAALAMALAPFAITIPFAFHIGLLTILKTAFIAAVFLRSLKPALSSVPLKTQLSLGLAVVYLTMAFSVLGAMGATGWGAWPDTAWRLSAALIAGHAHLWNHFIAPLLGWAPLTRKNGGKSDGIKGLKRQNSGEAGRSTASAQKIAKVLVGLAMLSQAAPVSTAAPGAAQDYQRAMAQGIAEIMGSMREFSPGDIQIDETPLNAMRQAGFYIDNGELERALEGRFEGLTPASFRAKRWPWRRSRARPLRRMEKTSAGPTERSWTRGRRPWGRSLSRGKL